MRDEDAAPDPSTFAMEGRVELFGYEPTTVQVRIRPRSHRWRAVGAAQRAGGGLVLAPLVALLPPHAVWAIGALAVGGILALRRWRERFTFEGVEGPCPRCGGGLSGDRGRLRLPHPLTCTECNHDAAVKLDPRVVEAHAA